MLKEDSVICNLKIVCIAASLLYPEDSAGLFLNTNKTEPNNIQMEKKNRRDR